MSDRLKNKRCLVTGAGAGIGRETALAFVREGATVVATDIDIRALESLALEDKAICTQVLDVSDSRAIVGVAAAGPPFDVVFNCAGYVHVGTLLETDFGSWRRSFTVNVDSMYHVCRAVLPGMIEHGGGSIINMASVASSIKGVPDRCAYSASKAAVIGLSKAIAADYVAQGIRCNAICPGTVKTPSLAQRVAALGGESDATWKSFADRQPMKRLGAAIEIAALALYLASDEAAFTTGAIHIIDGGWSN